MTPGSGIEPGPHEHLFSTSIFNRSLIESILPDWCFDQTLVNIFEAGL